MDFTVSEERRLLGDSLTRLLETHCSFDDRTRFAYASPYHSPTLWQALSELGLFHAFLPEDRGGIGGSGFDILAVFEPLGRALCPEPVLGQLLALRLLPEVDAALAGSEIWAMATGEPHAPWDLGETQARAQETEAGWHVTGAKSVVYGGPAATRVMIPALVGDSLALFGVDPMGLDRQDYAMIDGGGASELRLDQTPARMLVRDARSLAEDALDWGRLALCAEALGAMEAGFALLVDYLKTRQQFGRPLAAFQALQHRAVDLKLELEQARSITIRAAGVMGTDAQSKAVAQAKALIGQTAHLIAQETIQMQGGIAMTWEYPASHIAKRLTMIDHQLGDQSYHLRTLC